jgi:hypothetical protein
VRGRRLGPFALQITFTLVCCLPPASAQNPIFEGPRIPPANLWMTYPVVWSPDIDPVPTPVRQQRDQYFDDLIGLRTPLTPETAKGSGLSEGATYGPQAEFPTVPNRSVVIATFVSYRPVLSRSGRSIYTEVTFSISDVFQRSGGNAPGGAIVVILPGGTVTTPAGAVISFLTQPRCHCVKPGNTYLLVLGYRSAGSFYMLAKDWDLTSGVALPDFSAPKSTPSVLAGLTVEQLKKVLTAQGLQ